MLKTEDFDDPVSGYPSWIDTEVWIDYLLMQEITKNVDAMRASTFIYKENSRQGGKIKLGPVWDFNLAFGNINRSSWDHPRYWARYRGVSPTLFWWGRLMSDSTFATQFQERWWQLRENIFTIDGIHGFIDATAEYLDEAQERNFERWPILGKFVWPNPIFYDSYAEEVEHLKDWIADRVEWLDEHMHEAWAPTHAERDPPPVGDVLVYPNPSEDNCSLLYQTALDGHVRIEIYDVLGRLVVTLENADRPASTYRLDWSGSTRDGDRVPPGIYFYTFRFRGKLFTSGKLMRL